MNGNRSRLLLAAIGFLSAGIGGQALGHEHEVREPREMREPERESEDHSGSGRDNSTREEHESDDRSGSGHGGDRGDSGSRHGGRARESRSHGREPRLDLERDSRGAERVRGELVVIASRESLAAIRAAGFVFLERSELQLLDAEIVRIRAPSGRSLESMADELRRIAPDSQVAPQHVYRASASTPVATAAAGAAAAASDAGATRVSNAPRLGLVDTGVAAATPVLRQSLMATRGFATGGYVPRDHGTAVADIAARAGVEVISADVFGVDHDDEPVATALAVARAVDWLTVDGVRVINLSLEGPDNPVLARVVRRALERDVAIVAAVGNQGPAAPPSFPAAYDGVIAVTAVDGRDRPYRRAGQGVHVGFAARGVDVPVSGIDGRARRVSGTSFAAPLVAVVALQLRAARPDANLAALVEALRGQARDLGAPGRDVIFGWGELNAGPPLWAGRDANPISSGEPASPEPARR